MGKSARVIYWFRTDLRLHDSPALQAALDLDPQCLWPIFTWDPHYVYKVKGGMNRWQYLLDCQQDLSASITKLNPNSKLFILREGPQTLFPKLFRAWRVTHLVFERDTDAYARDRDAVVHQAARDAGVQVVTRSGRTLWDSDEIVRANGGEPTMSLTQLRRAGQKLGPVRRPLPAPSSLPDPGDMSMEEVDDGEHPPPPPPSSSSLLSDPNYNSRLRMLDKNNTSIAGPRGDFTVETLAEIGSFPEGDEKKMIMMKATTPHRGGETRALAQLDRIMNDVKYVATFRKPLTSPAALEEDQEGNGGPSTTLLSPFLHFGALSCRLFYHRVLEAIETYNNNNKGKGKDKEKEKASVPPESLTGQLLFRDMYFAAQAALGHAMTQTAYNPQVRFVPWHLPSKMKDVVDNDNNNKNNNNNHHHASLPSFNNTQIKQVIIPGEYEKEDINSNNSNNSSDADSNNDESRHAEEWFQRWAEGTTGFPWIDALMRQLRHDGWIHHLGRHSVACFLTRGGCYIHWERGADLFADLLLDHEPSCNAGNWQWLSCTAFFSQYHRCYGPVTFPRRWDPEGAFVRRWVPELAEVPGRYIYEPWKAPDLDLDKAGVRLVDFPGVGETMPEGTYPKPMFDFEERRKVCIARLKKAYAVGLRGNDQRVLDGSWRELFEGGDDEEMQEPPTHDSGDDAAVDEGAKSNDHGKTKPNKNVNKRAKGPMDRYVKKQKT